MGMFEHLLVRRLQKQQHRIQFCDIVIQAQDVSVPVHSSVLSAFSPRLCEFLSGLPALPGGKSRVIELEGVEGCTMLRLVRWLYTGTAEGEGAGVGMGMGKDLLKAAEKLGITLFQERGAREEDEKRGGDGEVTLKNNGVAFKRGIARWSEEERGMKRRVCKDAETQTDGEGGKSTVDTDTQTDLVDVTSSQSALCMYNNRPDLVDLQSAIAPLDALGQLPWVTGGCFHTAASVNEPTLLTTLTDDDAIPMELPSTLDESMVRQLIGAVEVAPTASATPDVETPLYLPAAAVRPGKDDHHRIASITGAAERLDDGNASAIEGRSELVEGFEQFEGNIPEFISYFLDSAGPGRRSGRRMRMRRARGGGGGGGGERGEKRARRPRGPRGAGGALAEKVAAEEKQTVGKVERRFPLREGRSVHVMWRGVGGGRVGTWLHLPPRKRCRARAYARQNSAQSQGKADNCQEKTPAIRKSRGRPPRIQSLPVNAHSSLHETDAVYEVLAHGPLTPTMLPALPLPPTQSRYYLDQLLLDLNQPSGAGGEQLEATRCSHTPMPADTTSPSMPCSVGKADDVCPVEEGEGGNRAKVHGEAEVVDSLKCLLMTLDESLDVKSSFTGVKDPQEGPPHSTESSENLPQQGGSEPPLSKARRRSRIPKASRLYRRSKGKRPVFRSGCKPFTWKSEVKGKDKDKKKAPSPKEQQESVLKEEMFEERRMTRNQAKRISETPSADPAPAPGEKGQQNDASENLPELPEQQQQQQQGEEEKQQKQQEKVALCKTLPCASGKNMSSLLRHCGEKGQQDDASENLIEHPERQQQQQEEEERQEREQEKVALCKTHPRASGKNMSLLRQKLLGKKRKAAEAAAAESPSQSAAEAPPSPSPRKRPRRLVVLQSPSAVATQGRE